MARGVLEFSRQMLWEQLEFNATLGFPGKGPPAVDMDVVQALHLVRELIDARSAPQAGPAAGSHEGAVLDDDFHTPGFHTPDQVAERYSCPCCSQDGLARSSLASVPCALCRVVCTGDSTYICEFCGSAYCCSCAADLAFNAAPQTPRLTGSAGVQEVPSPHRELDHVADSCSCSCCGQGGLVRNGLEQVPCTLCNIVCTGDVTYLCEVCGAVTCSCCVPNLNHMPLTPRSISSDAAPEQSHDFRRRKCRRDKTCSQCQVKVRKSKFGRLCRTCDVFVCSSSCCSQFMLSRAMCSIGATTEVLSTNPDACGDLVLCDVSVQLADEVSGMDTQQLLDEITNRPAPYMLRHAPSKFELRIAELLRDAISKHADSEIEASRHPTVENRSYAKFWSQHLWALTPAFLAIPSKVKEKRDEAQLHVNFEMAEVVRSRLQKAETGHWQALFAELLEIQRQDSRHLHEQFVTSSLADSGGEDWLFAKAGQKVRATN